MRRFLVALLLLLMAASGAVLYVVQQQVNQPLTALNQQFYTIKPGLSYHHLLKDFKARNWIDETLPLKIYAKLNPQFSALKAGTYQLPANSSFKSAVALFNSGIEHQFKITFIEGTTFKEWLAQLFASEYIKVTLDDKSSAKILTLLNSEFTHPEGLFYPDTYQFTAGTSDLDLLQRAYNRMAAELELIWQQKAENLPYKNSYQALIMASLIEKETGQLFEQPVIAAVFINRLNKKMRLQTDPTIIYGLGDRYTGDITYANLREKTKYNTYQIKGLPPTPIAMPGKSALIASMHPAQSSYLYFVSKGNGEHYFSKTLAEHNKAVDKYIRGKK